MHRARRHRQSTVTLALLVALVGLGGCSSAAWQSPAPAAVPPRLVVVTTTSLVSGLVREVAGDGVEVRQVVPPKADPVTYRPPATSTGVLDGADVTFHHGLGLETGLEPFLAVAVELGPVIGVADGIPADRLLPPDAVGRVPTPAVWLDPSLWSLALDEVAGVLVELNPAMTDTYLAAATRAKDRYTALSSYLDETLAMVPAGRRSVVTLESGVAYLLASREFAVTPLPATVGDRWVTEDDAAAVAETVVAADPRLVLVPVRLQGRGTEALTAALAARGTAATILPVTLDSLGRPGTLEASYEAMMRGLAEAISVSLVVENG